MKIPGTKMSNDWAKQVRVGISALDKKDVTKYTMIQRGLQQEYTENTLLTYMYINIDILPLYKFASIIPNGWINTIIVPI